MNDNTFRLDVQGICGLSKVLLEEHEQAKSYNRKETKERRKRINDSSPIDGKIVESLLS